MSGSVYHRTKKQNGKNYSEEEKKMVLSDMFRFIHEERKMPIPVIAQTFEKNITRLNCTKEHHRTAADHSG